MSKWKFYLVLLIINTLHLKAQNTSFLQNAESDLNESFEQLFQNDGSRFTQPDHLMWLINNDIEYQFIDLLKYPASFDYPFDSLKRIGIRYSNDRKVKVYTWNIKLSDGTHRYFGFIQHKVGKDVVAFHLKEDTTLRKEIQLINYDQKNWWGMNYYQVVDFKHRGKTYYLLMGMRNNGYVSKTKVLDILSFNRKQAKFGKSMFKNEKNRLERIVFEYNHKVSMVMNYDANYKMVIFDHLAPETPALKDQFRFYGPDGSYDAYQFDGDKWVYRPEQWIVNERNKLQENLKKPIEEKTIY